MAFRWSTGIRNKQNGIYPEKITNGGFGSDTANWTAVGATLSSAAGGDSGNCLKITCDGAAVGKAYQDVTVIPGHLYRLMVKQKDGSAGGATYTGRVFVGSAADEDLIYDSGTITNAAWAAVVTMGADGIYFVVPAGVSTARITLLTVGAVAGDNTLFDTCSLHSMARSIQDIFENCVVDFYNGTQPASANDAPGATKLVAFYSDGVSAGLSFDDSVSGVIPKKSTETWSGTGLVTGTATWFRVRTLSDSGGSSTTDERIDGSISTSGAELNMNDPTITLGVVQAITSFQITTPAS